MNKEKILSVFIDESGDFGEYRPEKPYYIVSMVLHNQDINISNEIKDLDSKIETLGFPKHAVHIGPIIRKEQLYKQYSSITERKALLNSFYHFTRKINFTYMAPFIQKEECSNVIQLTSKLSRAISNCLKDRFEYMNSFDKIIVYYDNGQKNLTQILTSVFSVMFTNIEFRTVKPSDYKLFQVADFICTWELLALKAENGTFTDSEKEFFNSPRNFKKNYLKLIRHKKV